MKPVQDLILKEMHNGLRRRLEAVQKARLDRDKNPELGRKFVAAYVDYIHYIVNLHELASGPKEQAEGQQPRHSCDGE